ncbi:hypothetical protein CIP107532_01788 [Corynebacterium diphtheriae]|nr:hypothetical protein CIP107514_01676 [Corynebacterium diphtheriae]CAB0574019.1 hypothetical protein CIP107532_01788 [Corynebacterium diphtheriae]
MTTPTTTPVTSNDEEGIVEVIGSGPKALHTVSATPAADQPPAAPTEHTGTIDLYEPILDILTSPEI